MPPKQYADNGQYNGPRGSGLHGWCPLAPTVRPRPSTYAAVEAPKTLGFQLATTNESPVPSNLRSNGSTAESIGIETIRRPSLESFKEPVFAEMLTNVTNWLTQQDKPTQKPPSMPCWRGRLDSAEAAQQKLQESTDYKNYVVIYAEDINSKGAKQFGANLLFNHTLYVPRFVPRHYYAVLPNDLLEYVYPYFDIDEFPAWRIVREDALSAWLSSPATPADLKEYISGWCQKNGIEFSAKGLSTEIEFCAALGFDFFDKDIFTFEQLIIRQVEAIIRTLAYNKNTVFRGTQDKSVHVALYRTDSKMSWHVHVDNMQVQLADLQEAVLDSKKRDARWFDAKVYGRNRSFRLPGSSKLAPAGIPFASQSVSIPGLDLVLRPSSIWTLYTGLSTLQNHRPQLHVFFGNIWSNAGPQPTSETLKRAALDIDDSWYQLRCVYPTEVFNYSRLPYRQPPGKQGAEARCLLDSETDICPRLETNMTRLAQDSSSEEAAMARARVIQTLDLVFTNRWPDAHLHDVILGTATTHSDVDVVRDHTGSFLFSFGTCTFCPIKKLRDPTSDGKHSRNTCSGVVHPNGVSFHCFSAKCSDWIAENHDPTRHAANRALTLLYSAPHGSVFSTGPVSRGSRPKCILESPEALETERRSRLAGAKRDREEDEPGAASDSELAEI